MDTRSSFIWVGLAVGLFATDVTRAANLGKELSPFLPPSEKHVSLVAPTLELRGVVHEGGAVYLTFFESASKKWLTLTPGEEREGYALEGFDETNYAATVRTSGHAITVAMKMDGQHARSSRRAVANLASTATPQPTALTAVSAPGLSSSEAHRLELVASEIRQQIKRIKFLAMQTEAPAKS